MLPLLGERAGVRGKGHAPTLGTGKGVGAIFAGDIECSMVISWGRLGTLLQFFDADIAERNVAVIALKKNRAGLVDSVVELAARGFGAFDVVMDFYAVEGEADFVSNDGRFGGLAIGRRVWRRICRAL